MYALQKPENTCPNDLQKEIRYLQRACTLPQVRQVEKAPEFVRICNKYVQAVYLTYQHGYQKLVAQYARFPTLRKTEVNEAFFTAYLEYLRLLAKDEAEQVKTASSSHLPR